MSRLYDIVNKTINASSMTEAEQILFGSNGIVINSPEYYKNIISNFVRKKETIIKKNVAQNGKTYLIFDLNDCNDIWNILFIYNYYIHYIEQKIESLNKQIKKNRIVQQNLESKKETLAPNDLRYQEITNEISEVLFILNNLKDLKNRYSSYKNESLKKYAVQLENMNNIDEHRLKQQLDKLKEAIACIQKMRDALEHTNESLNIDNVVSIDNPTDKFEITIPIEYLDGFNKGRIVANEEDKILVEQTNNISSPLLETLDYDVKKIDSFFYNVEPNYLEFILEKVNYDAQQLYKLSYYIFEYKLQTKFFLKNGLDLFSISKLPKTAFEHYENTIKFLNNNIDIYRIPEESFCEVYTTIEMFRKGIDIYRLPEQAFRNPKHTMYLVDEGIDIYNLPEGAFLFFDPQVVINLLKANINIYNLPEGAFLHPDIAIKLYNAEIDIYKLSNDSFYDYEDTMKLHKAGVDIYNLPEGAFINIDFTIYIINQKIDISKLPIDAFLNPEITKKLIDNKIDICKLPSFVFSSRLGTDTTTDYWDYDGYFEESYKKIIKLIESGVNIYRLPEQALRNPKGTMILYEKGIDIYRLSSGAFWEPTNVVELFEAGIDIYKLVDSAFYYPQKTIKLFKENIDIYKLSNKFFDVDVEIGILKQILDKVGYEQLNTLPIEFFCCNIELLDSLFQKYNLNISKSIFGINNPKIIAALVYANSVLSNYDKNNKNISTIDMDIQPYSIIAGTYIDNFNYRKNIDENIGREYSFSEFVEQFKLLDENDFDRSIDETRKSFLIKIRNACAHFRFKPVKDRNGNILEDKIYIYDEDNKGENNFNLIIDLKYLIEIIRKVEIQIELQKKQIISESTKKR